MRWSLRKIRVIIGDSNDENESQRRDEEAEREVLIMSKLGFGLRKRVKALVGKSDTLWSIFTTLARLFEGPLLLVSFGILISFNHYAHK